MVDLETVFKILRKAFSPLCKFIGGSSFENFSSVFSSNCSQSAFLKFINVLSSLVIGFISVSMEMVMGTWSELMMMWVSQVM